MVSLSPFLSDGHDYVAMIRFGWRSAASTSLSLSLIRHDEAHSRTGNEVDRRDRFYCVLDHLAELSRIKRRPPERVLLDPPGSKHG